MDTMTRPGWLGLLIVSALCVQLSDLTAWQTPAAVKAAGSLELTDPAGDVQPIIYRRSVGNGPEREVKYPAFDVVKLALSSDGKAITIAATLTAPPALASYEVLELFVDADNNAKTGITLPGPPSNLTGLEFYGTLEDCLEHDMFGTTCAGTDEKPKGHSAIVTLEKYGKDWMFKDTLLSIPASGSVKEPKKVAVVGPLVQASVEYSAMGVKPGQTIRLMVREACAATGQGFFPEIVFALK
jgi:hypothetical protein